MLIHPIPIDIKWPNSHKVFGWESWSRRHVTTTDALGLSREGERSLGCFVYQGHSAWDSHNFPHIFSNFWSSTFFFGG